MGERRKEKGKEKGWIGCPCGFQAGADLALNGSAGTVFQEGLRRFLPSLRYDVCRNEVGSSALWKIAASIAVNSAAKSVPNRRALSGFRLASLTVWSIRTWSSRFYSHRTDFIPEERRGRCCTGLALDCQPGPHLLL